MGNSKKSSKTFNEVSLVELSLIDKSSFNPRKKFDETALYELSESIKKQGVLQPIKIRPVSATNRYEIVLVNAGIVLRLLQDWKKYQQ